MVQLTPDTRLTGWDGCSGYHFSDDVVYGFSHTHLSGTGVGDYGDILLMPVTGEPQLDNGYPDRADEGYGSRFAKASEQAGAGWYAVHLDDYGIDVELTATPRTGLHRYVFPAGPAGPRDRRPRAPRPAAGRGPAASATTAPSRASGARAPGRATSSSTSGRAFSRPFTATAPGAATPTGRARQGRALVRRRGRRAAGAGGHLGGRRRRAPAATWRPSGPTSTSPRPAPGPRGLGRGAGAASRSRAPAERDLAILATALYHSFIAPNLFSDVDGRYRGMDLRDPPAPRGATSTRSSRCGTPTAPPIPCSRSSSASAPRDFVRDHPGPVPSRAAACRSGSWPPTRPTA